MNTRKLIIPGMVALASLSSASIGSIISAAGAHADTLTSTSSTVANIATRSTAPTATAIDESRAHHSANGITETLLTGDTKTRAVAAAQTAEPGATVLRAETDAEGATYEVHLQKADGTRLTVKLDSSFTVTASESGRSRGHNRANTTMQNAT